MDLTHTQPKVELKFLTPDAMNMIGEMASICYDADTSEGANLRRAKKCKDSGHLATMRFTHATFNVSNISRITSHQFVRSKHLDFLQRSQRYCFEVKQDYAIPESIASNPLLLAEYEAAIKVSRLTYEKLLQQGVKKEDARFVLPEATFTKLNVTGNLQAWQDFIKLRKDKAAQWEIHNVACQIEEILHEHLPDLF